MAALRHLFLRRLTPTSTALLRPFSSSSAPIKPASYAVKPKDPEPSPPPEAAPRDPPQEAPPATAAPPLNEISSQWTRADARYVKDGPSISPVSHPSRVAPLPEDKPRPAEEEMKVEGEQEREVEGEQERKVEREREQERKVEVEELQREARVIRRETQARSYFRGPEEVQVSYPTMLLPEKRPQKVAMELSEAIRLVKLGPDHYCRNFSSRASDVQSRYSAYGGPVQDQQDDREIDQSGASDIVHIPKQRFGSNISSEEKRKFLINTLFDLKDSKEAVYGTLDTWVAWEQIFPLVSLKKALLVLEKEQQWHRVVQIIKWMLSKGQGTTVGTYEQLIRALEKDNRAEEAHKIWVKKLSHDLHSAPWRVCELMISIYYRNNMLERLVKLFKGLESYDRKPPTKSIVQKVADAYEMLGHLEEKNRVMEKYSDLFNKPSERFKKFRKTSRKKENKTGTEKDKKLEAWNAGVVDSGPDEEFEVA